MVACKLRINVTVPSGGPPLRRPLQAHHRLPEQRSRFPSREEAFFYTLNHSPLTSFFFLSWVQGKPWSKNFCGLGLPYFIPFSRNQDLKRKSRITLMQSLQLDLNRGRTSVSWITIPLIGD